MLRFVFTVPALECVLIGPVEYGACKGNAGRYHLSTRNDEILLDATLSNKVCCRWDISRSDLMAGILTSLIRFRLSTCINDRSRYSLTYIGTILLG